MSEDLNLREIGYIAKAHGIKGELFFKPFEEGHDWFLEVKELYIDKVKYNLKKSRPHQVGYILILEEVSDRNKAETLKGKRLSLEASFFENSEEEKEYFLNQIEGFEVFLNNEFKGKVEGFMSTTAHEIISVRTEEGLFEIPWVKPFIKEILFEARKINLDCPKELFEKDFGLKD